MAFVKGGKEKNPLDAKKPWNERKNAVGSSFVTSMLPAKKKRPARLFDDDDNSTRKKGIGGGLPCFSSSDVSPDGKKNIFARKDKGRISYKQAIKNEEFGSAISSLEKSMRDFKGGRDSTTGALRNEVVQLKQAINLMHKVVEKELVSRGGGTFAKYLNDGKPLFPEKEKIENIFKALEVRGEATEDMTPQQILVQQLVNQVDSLEVELEKLRRNQHKRDTVMSRMQSDINQILIAMGRNQSNYTVSDEPDNMTVVPGQTPTASTMTGERNTYNTTPQMVGDQAPHPPTAQDDDEHWTTRAAKSVMSLFGAPSSPASLRVAPGMDLVLNPDGSRVGDTPGAAAGSDRLTRDEKNPVANTPEEKQRQLAEQNRKWRVLYLDDVNTRLNKFNEFYENIEERQNYYDQTKVDISKFGRPPAQVQFQDGFDPLEEKGGQGFSARKTTGILPVTKSPLGYSINQFSPDRRDVGRSMFNPNSREEDRPVQLPTGENRGSRMMSTRYGSPGPQMPKASYLGNDSNSKVGLLDGYDRDNILREAQNKKSQAQNEQIYQRKSRVDTSPSDVQNVRLPHTSLFTLQR